MTRLEAIGLLVSFGVVGVLSAWLGLSLIWGRRRIPERLVLRLDPEEIGPGVAIPVQGDPRRIVIEPEPLAEAWNWPTTPPSSRVFDRENPRPWAHG